MAASVAPTSTRTPRIPNATATESSTNETNHPKDNCNSNNINTQKPTLNSQELCRSCGKTSEDLYDLYHHQPSTSSISSNNSASTLPQSTAVDETTMPSPFTTSSTTCYAKSCTESATLMANSTTSSSNNTAAACPSTAISSGTSATTTTTFDSVAATAKATAKGQSNMENILQEMQIWHLQIKCNDGLPQRICAKCTAQFYMIHKFRKKCLKVQSQLRSLYEEQQDKVQQHKAQQPQQMLVEEKKKEEQQVQNNVANAIAIPVVGEETKPKPTLTLPSSTSSSSLETPKVPSLSDNASTTELLHINNELINDKHEQENLQPTTAFSVTSVSLPSTITTTNQEKPIQDAKIPTAPTLRDNVVETMGHAKETTEESEPKSSLLFYSNINQDAAKSVKTAELTSAKETTSTSECSKPQSCDNDKTIVEEPMVKRTRRGTTERSRSLDKCDDNMLTEGQKTILNDAGDDRQSKKLAEDAGQDAVAASHVQIEKRRGRPRKTEQLTRSKSTPECCSLLTKAALKSYSTIITRANSSAYDKASTAVSSTRRQQTANSLKKDEAFEEYQELIGKQTEPKMTTAVVAVKKTHNDDNNNDRSHQNDVDEGNKVSQPNLSNSSAQTKEASSIFTRRCSKHKSKKMSKTEAKTDNNSKRRAAEQMQNQLGDAVPRLKRKCSRRSDNKRPGDDHHQHNELCEKSTVKRALRSSAHTPEIIKSTHRRKRERRRRPEAAYSKISILEPEDESRRHHTPKKLPRLEYVNETFGEETDENAMTNNDVVTKKDFAFATSKFSTTKANLNTLKEDLSKFPPSTLYSSAMSAKASTPAAKSLLNEDYKTLMAHDANDMKWQRRRSQRLSSSSSSSMSSSSSSSLSTTDDDDDDDIDYYDDDVYYETNAYQRLQKMTNSTTSIPSLYFWKTKAEMKANSDDIMPMQDIYKNVTTPKKSDDSNRILSPNHTLTAAKETIQDANTSSGSLTEGMRLHTLNDNEMDQGTVDDPKETKETDTPNHYISDTKNCHGDDEEDDDQHRAQEVAANDGDDEEENDNEDCVSVCDRPEKADQKQIKLKPDLTNERFDNNDAVDSETQCSEAETNCSSSNKEFNNQNNQEDSKQKPAISIPTNADEATTTLTPPVNESKSSGSCESAEDNRVRGGMKLILQRRSSTRFACLRKEDIVEEQAVGVAAAVSTPSSRPSSPVRKRKRKQHEEETLLESSPLNNKTKSIDEEEKEIVQQIDGTLDTATLTNSQENKRYRIEDQHVNEIESKTALQTEASQTHSDNIKLKTNNPEEYGRKYETAKCPGSDSVDHKTEKITSATEEGTLDKLHILTLPDTDTSVLNAPLVTGKESCEQEKETGNSQKLLVRVPLASLTQHFKRMHLTKDGELQAQQELDKGEQHSASNDKENQEGQQDEEQGNVSSEKFGSTLQETEEKIEFVTESPVNSCTSTPEEEKTNQEENTASIASEDIKDEISKEAIKESVENAKNDVIEDKISINSGSKSEIMDEVKNEPASQDDVKTEDDRNTSLTLNDANMPLLDENEMLKSPSSSQDSMQQIKDSKTCANISEESQNKSLVISSLHSDILEFVQESASVEAVNEITPTFCGASSKITDFINDFQNNCINSPDVEADTNTVDAISTLAPSSNPNLSAEIRDVEDTLNGILSEMHDRDMYTPRSGENEDFLAHSSIYSPMTEAPTTPSQSLYAESPRTVNSNPMSLSPFIQSHMDYNAMTPQSNHSSMGSHTPATMSSTSSSHPNGGVSSDHFPTYTDCFAEESTQSELIGFQNDIPCFENIDLSVNDEGLAEVSEIPNDVQDTPKTPCKQYSNQDLLESLDKSNDIKKDVAEFPAEKLEASLEPGTVVPLPELGEIATVEENTTADSNMQYEKTEDLSPANIQTDTISELPHTTDNNTDISDEKLIHPQFVLTNTTHGPVFISTPPENVTPVHQQNVQYVTMDANNHHASKVNWCNQNAPAAAATYYVNASGEIYLGNPTFNALVMPQQQSATQSSAAMETNENYVQVYQEHEQQQQQDQQQNNNNPSQQYIMVLNNLTTGAQQYITNPTTTPTVLLHTQLANNNCNYVNSQSTIGEIEQNSNGTTDHQVPATTMPTFSIATSMPGQHATVPIDTRSVESLPTPARQREINRHNVHKLLQQKIQQQKPIKPRPVPGQRTQQKINLICRFCHKRPKFTNNVDYSNHIITMHPAEKPYNCDYCPKHFQRRTERQDHVAQVHGSRYQCAQCGVSFCAQRALDFHLQKFHASSTLCTIPPRIATVAPTQQLQSSSASSTLALNHLQQNSTSSTSSSSSSTSSSSSSSLSAASSPSSYNLLHSAQQQRLVHHHHHGAAEDVHAHNEDEEEETKHNNNNNNKCSFDSQLEIMNETTMKQRRYQQPTRKLCCPDCDGDDAASCCSTKSNPPNNHKQLFNQQQFAVGNLSVYGGNQQLQINIPSPEQIEPDSTTTLRHFRKNVMKCPSAVPTNCPGISSCMTYSACTYGSNSKRPMPATEYHVGEKCISRELYNCHLCSDAFPTAHALRKHRNIIHNNQCTMPFICTICKRGFRLRNALQRHMETHDAEGRPYECNICQVRFPRPSQLTLHKLTVHKFEKVHTCNECGKQFGTESSLKAHEKVSHEASSMPLPFACVYLEAPKNQKPKISKD